MVLLSVTVNLDHLNNLVECGYNGRDTFAVTFNCPRPSERVWTIAFLLSGIDISGNLNDLWIIVVPHRFLKERAFPQLGVVLKPRLMGDVKILASSIRILSNKPFCRLQTYSIYWRMTDKLNIEMSCTYLGVVTEIINSGFSRRTAVSQFVRNMDLVLDQWLCDGRNLSEKLGLQLPESSFKAWFTRSWTDSYLFQRNRWSSERYENSTTRRCGRIGSVKMIEMKVFVYFDRTVTIHKRQILRKCSSRYGYWAMEDFDEWTWYRYLVSLSGLHRKVKKMQKIISSWNIWNRRSTSKPFNVDYRWSFS